MPVAESELVAGYMVEYTGFRFLFFFIGEFGTAFAFAALAGDDVPRRLVDPVDGGMADNLDAALTGQGFEAALATRMTARPTR
jgi:NADH:ubiquinone oxidoreductase subunit 1 (chain H)